MHTHELLPSVPEMTSPTHQSSLCHLGPQLLIRYTTRHLKQGMNDNCCLGYKSVQLTPGSNAINLPQQINFFKRKGKTDVYFVFGGGNPMEKGKSDIKILTPWPRLSLEGLSRFY